MNNPHLDPDEIPELDPQTADRLLNNVFTECNVAPNSIPLEVLESWGNYKKTEFRFGRMISYTVLVLLVLMPLLFFKPTIITQRTNVDSTSNAAYKIQIKTLMPVSGVTATLNGIPVSLQKVDSKNYIVSIVQNGVLEIEAAALNGQVSTKRYDVAHLDMENPKLLKSYTENGNVYLVVSDTYSGIDYDKISALDADQNPTETVSADKDSGTIAYAIPSSTVTVSIPDKSGNILQILLSPAN